MVNYLHACVCVLVTVNLGSSDVKTCIKMVLCSFSNIFLLPNIKLGRKKPCVACDRHAVCHSCICLLSFSR